MTQKEAVYNIIKSRKWTPGDMIKNAGGGRDGLRRLRELRAEGYEIKRRNRLGQNEYRMVSKPHGR